MRNIWKLAGSYFEDVGRQKDQMETHAEMVESIIEYRQERHNKIARKPESIGLETDLLKDTDKLTKKEQKGIAKNNTKQFCSH